MSALAQPPVGRAAQELYDRLAPIYGLEDAQRDWSLLYLCAAFTAGLEPLYELDDPALLPWAIALDVDACPTWALPWLAWILGVTVRETGEQLRALIRDLPPAHRGTPDAMRAAVARVLDGTRSVRYLPRADGPFQDTIVTRPSETPAGDQISEPQSNLIANPNGRDAPYAQGWTTTTGASLEPAVDPDFDGHGLLTGWYSDPSDRSTMNLIRGDRIPVSELSWLILRCRAKVLAVASPTWGFGVRLVANCYATDSSPGPVGTFEVDVTGLSASPLFDGPPAPGAIIEFAGIGQVPEGATRLSVRLVLSTTAPAGSSGRIVCGRVMLAEADGEDAPVLPYFEGTQQPTQQVLAAAEPQRRVGSVLTHVITDDPLINDWTRAIDDVDVAIDSLTLPDVT